MACFPVYRTYIHKGVITDRDRRVIQRAVARAKRRNPAHSSAVFDFIRDVLLLEQPPELDDAGKRDREVFVGRFQQVTSPVMAKGIEDTAFYRYFPLASLNEVGGDPDASHVSVQRFHQENLARRAQYPHALIATTTHDTKRSEDVRARIGVLSEAPLLWRAALNRWARLNRHHRRQLDGLPAPSRNDEYLFYQSLVGVWPLAPPRAGQLRQLVERLQAYMEKATREAKLHTSWISPEPHYDAAVREFVAAALDDHPKNRFLAEFRKFHEQVVDWGLYTALTQVVLKLTSPGVPDIYQGQELWDFSLVDPDNRRPVDFALRREMLGQLRAAVVGGPAARIELARTLARYPRDPRLKLYVTWQLIEFRRQNQALFAFGGYVPLEAAGACADHVCAFAWRTADGARPAVAALSSPAEARPAVAAFWPASAASSTAEGVRRRTMVVIAPRLIARLMQSVRSPSSPAPLGTAAWRDTTLVAPGLDGMTWENLLTGQRWEGRLDGQPLAAALEDFPVAVLAGS
jgi:(1->4)-alpha-D-glucan 1-alpha-D-glucosylmutase